MTEAAKWQMSVEKHAAGLVHTGLFVDDLLHASIASPHARRRDRRGRHEEVGVEAPGGGALDGAASANALSAPRSHDQRNRATQDSAGD